MWKFPDRRIPTDLDIARRDGMERKIIAARKAAGQDTTVWRCYMCDTPIKDNVTAKWVHFGNGGDCAVTAEEAAKDPAGDLGCYPVGPECFRKHKKGLTPYVVPGCGAWVDAESNKKRK